MEPTEIVRVLSDSLTDEGVRQWLSAPSMYLDSAVPAELLQAGQHDRVLEAARALIQGAYI